MIQRVPIEEDEINRAIQMMRTRGTYPDAVFEVVREDMRMGITRKETRRYTDVFTDIRQIRVCSNCLRKGFADEMIRLICDKNYDATTMETLYGIAEDGASISTLEKILKEADGNPHHMKKLYESMKEQQAKLEEERILASSDQTERENQEIMEEDTKPNLKQEEETKSIQTVENELKEKNAIIERQKDEITQANAALARLRKEKEKVEEGIKLMQLEMMKKLDSMSQDIHELLEHRKETETQEVFEEGEMELAQEEEKKTEKPMHYTDGYQAVISDGSGKGSVPIFVECKERKLGGIIDIFGKIMSKPKSRVDIVKMVVAGDLMPAQLTQIKIAIERGLKENQLVELIHSNASVEKMKEIIEIAVLENELA